MARKEYHWIRLFDDFYDNIHIKRLRQISGGDTFVLIYQRMLIKARNSSGILFYEGIMSEFSQELALDLGENPDNVKLTLEYLLSHKLLQVSPDGRKFLLTAYRQEGRNLVGENNDSAARMQKLRVQEQFLLPAKPEPKTNAERQANHKAKMLCKAAGNVPMISDAENKKKYGGKYYLTFKENDFKCCKCGSKNNLMIHFVGNEKCDAKNVSSNEICDAKNVSGNEKSNESNVTSNEIFVTSNEKSNEKCQLITLCDKCYSEFGNENNGSNEVLEISDFTECSNASNEICDASNVIKKCDGNEKCDAIDIDIDININQSSSSSACAREEDFRYLSNEISDSNKNRYEDDPAEKSIPDKAVLDQVVKQWNALTDVGIKPLHMIWQHGTQGRRITELLDIYGFESLSKIVTRIRDSDYLQGKTVNRGYPIDFDWLLKDDNYQNVLNGKYDTRRSGLPSKRQPSKVQNFIQMQERKENWDVLESKLLDN